MPPPGPRFTFRIAQFKFREGFTLLELLGAIVIIALLMVLVAPTFTKLKWANDLTAAAYTIAGALEQGRNYAMANNTCVWIGFYEENMTATSPTQTTPPYPGKGRVLVATVFSTDGTKIYEDADPMAQLLPNRIKQLGKLIKLEGIHITDIGAPAFSRWNGKAGFAFSAENYTFLGWAVGLEITDPARPSSSPVPTPSPFPAPAGMSPTPPPAIPTYVMLNRPFRNVGSAARGSF